MKKTLHMVGNSHIDPVWFWRWEEGMQEVRATFRSALDRMNEFPEFTFSCTSAAFFAYIQRVDPDMLEEIKERVKQGRWEITGGWWVEPDCNLPGGESFVRQGLYGQRSFEKMLGVHALIGSNVDSFGHAPQLPQILKKSGMQGYVFLRPQVTSAKREYTQGRKCVFLWQGSDGTTLPAVSLPGEYTAWFYEQIKKNVVNTLRELKDFPSLPCCYGVGNHGGGPTKENIQAVKKLQNEFPETELRFSGFEPFFKELEAQKDTLVISSCALDHVNPGCYSVDLRFKQAMRQAQQELINAEKLMSMRRLLCGAWQPEKTEPLWQRTLFNQFHDTLGGTITMEAHADALNDVNGVRAQAAQISNLAMQDMIRHMAIEGEGVPIVFFNMTEKPVREIADVEIDWFCRDPLRLTDQYGQEKRYARIKQSCTMEWTVLGGRRRLLFEATVPAYSTAVYYATAMETTLNLSVAHSGENDSMENELVALRLNEQGDLCSLVDKHTGYDALNDACRFDIWKDERDPWGGGPKTFAPEALTFEQAEVKCIEKSDLRTVIRVQKKTAGLRLDMRYILCQGDDFVTLYVDLWWDKPWHQLRYSLACDAKEHVSEAPYGVMLHGDKDDEKFMHSFLDCRQKNGAGVAVSNDGLYGFEPMGNRTDLLILRSSIYAQGTSPDWEKPYDVYHYIDLGEQHFKLCLKPHGNQLPQEELFTFADKTQNPPLWLVGGCCGNHGTAGLTPFQIDRPNVRLGAIKKAEDDNGFIIRLHETAGRSVEASLSFAGGEYPLSFHPYEIKTLHWLNGCLAQVNMLER